MQIYPRWFWACAGIVLLLSGCVALDGIGVKGLPVSNGVYVGAHSVYDYTYTDETVTTNYLDVGFSRTSIEPSEMLEAFDSHIDDGLFYRLSLSIADSEDDYASLDVAGGAWFASMGYEFNTRPAGDFYRYYFSIAAVPLYYEFVPGYMTVSLYGGETDKQADIDMHWSLIFDEGNIGGSYLTTYFSFGQRFSIWEERSGAAVFFALSADSTESGGPLIEFSQMFDNSEWYISEDPYSPPPEIEDKFEVRSRTALSFRWYI